MEVLFPKELREIYTQNSLKNQSSRWTRLLETFEIHYAHPPDFVARAPGRVNIIGEHIDYSRFSVLPSAIEPDLLIAASAEYQSEKFSGNRPIHVRAINLNPSYPETTFIYQPKAGRIPIRNGGWSDYLKSAFNTSLDHLTSDSTTGELRLPTSIEFLIDGTVPAGSGLSSSAAITTAAVLAVLYIHQTSNQSIPKSLVASLAIAAEQACGVSVGGMDQSASVFGQPAKLLHIEFTPMIQVVPLQLPSIPATTFIIANSLVTSTKLDSAKKQYNLRVVECRIATRMLWEKLVTKGKQEGGHPKDLRELVERYSPPHEPIPLAIQRLLDALLANPTLLGGPHHGLTQHNILQLLSINQHQFDAEILAGMVVEPPGGIYKPYNRARHVLNEALRVYKFRELLERTEGSGDDKASELTIEKIGELMRESQRSCGADYECSCEELDALVAIGEAHGSLGSRLTGAGWGGSSVHLVRDADTSRVIQALVDQYYTPNFPHLSAHQLAEACFPTKPQGGACLFKHLPASFST